MRLRSYSDEMTLPKGYKPETQVSGPCREPHAKSKISLFIQAYLIFLVAYAMAAPLILVPISVNGQDSESRLLLRNIIFFLAAPFVFILPLVLKMDLNTVNNARNFIGFHRLASFVPIVYVGIFASILLIFLFTYILPRPDLVITSEIYDVIFGLTWANSTGHSEFFTVQEFIIFFSFIIFYFTIPTFLLIRISGTYQYKLARAYFIRCANHSSDTNKLHFLRCGLEAYDLFLQRFLKIRMDNLERLFYRLASGASVGQDLNMDELIEWIKTNPSPGLDLLKLLKPKNEDMVSNARQITRRTFEDWVTAIGTLVIPIVVAFITYLSSR